MEQILLEITSKHIKDKKVIVSNCHGFMKKKSCLTNMIAFCNEMSGGCCLFLILTRILTFDIVSSNILIDKLIKRGLGN